MSQHPAHAGRMVATKEEREVHGGRAFDRKHASVETKSFEGKISKIGAAKPGGIEAEKAARATPAPIVRVEPEPAVSSGPPVSAVDSDPEAANLNHDRKIHHSADEEEPRKAMPLDFMSTGAEKSPIEVAPVPPPTSLPPAAPVAALVVKSKPRVAAPTQSSVVKLVAAEAVPAPVDVAMTYRRGRLVIPPAMKGSYEILLHQNEMADVEGLERIRDDEDLEAMRESRQLVPIPAVQGMQIDERLPANRRYTRPWTAVFLTALARAHYQRLHSALQVNSAVRTVEFQERLMMTNGNAAPAEGATASPHLTGQAVDLAKHGLSTTEIAWLRGYLLPLVQQGKVDVEEEFQQACFHVSVYKKYMPQAAPRRMIPPHHGAATALAAALP